MKFVPKSEATRTFIIEATAELFNKKGFAGTSITDLEKATHLTKGSIYGNFLNKEEVAVAAFDFNLAKRRNKIREGMSLESTFKGKLLAYAESYRDPLLTVGGCPVINTVVDADDTNPLLRKRAAEAMEERKVNLMELVKQGIAAHEFRADLEPESFALTFISLLHGATIIYQSTQSLKSLHIVVDSAVGLVENACMV